MISHLYSEMDGEDDIPIKALTEIETEGCFPTLYVLTVYEKGNTFLESI